MRLSTATASTLPAAIRRPDYPRRQQPPGIVHIGIGAFHRAHQAVYSDDALAAGESGWEIVGVSLRSSAVAEQLNPQDGWYTLITRSAAGDQLRLIGAVQQVLVASTQAAAVVAAIAAATTKLVTFTVTEKGYCRASDGSLDLALADAGSFYPLLQHALALRQHQGLPGLTLLSCDNLANNGAQLARLFAEYLSARQPALLPWFQSECACPSSMVDRIVPATTAADRATLATQLSLTDEAAVLTEPYSQWVIEDRLVGPRPPWQAHGVQFVTDVAPWEAAKLRMLNGAHSALAYLGLARGHTFVHEAMADPLIGQQVQQLMLHEAAPTLPAIPGFYPHTYAAALCERFRNPALHHRLAQIAMDGSQKIPQRWLQTVAAASTQGRDTPIIRAALGAWIRHTQGANGPVDDPLAAQLTQLWQHADLAQGIEAIFGRGPASLVAPLPDAMRRQLLADLSI